MVGPIDPTTSTTGYAFPDGDIRLGRTDDKSGRELDFEVGHIVYNPS
jgi:hypothetical protein